MGKQATIELIERMEKTNPNYLQEQIDAYDHEYAMQKAAGIMYFSEENLAKVPKILDLFEEIKSDRTKIEKFIN